ncbi:hypothetical protein BYT27DRAFT_6836995 [Phlegmacium glaucopus]|nr:hypothetical protein BYT27DRAFT_6836995 [Phlegmacium glaucopus]
MSNYYKFYLLFGRDFRSKLELRQLHVTSRNPSIEKPVFTVNKHHVHPNLLNELVGEGHRSAWHIRVPSNEIILVFL